MTSESIFMCDFQLRHHFLPLFKEAQRWPGLPSGHVIMAGAPLVCGDKGELLKSLC